MGYLNTMRILGLGLALMFSAAGDAFGFIHILWGRAWISKRSIREAGVEGALVYHKRTEEGAVDMRELCRVELALCLYSISFRARECIFFLFRVGCSSYYTHFRLAFSFPL